MSTDGSSNGAPGGESLASATKRTLEGVQAARLAGQLRELSQTRDMVRALGHDPDQYAARLVKQYRDLTLKLRQPAPPRKIGLPPRLVATLNQLADIFGPWQSILTPDATVALIQAPGGPDIGGVGLGATIYQGDLALGGEVSNASSQEQWWVNTWQYSAQFPTTPADFAVPGSLAYRFNVGAALNLYRQDVMTGSVHVYATVATTNDLTNKPIDFSDVASSDFAISAALPGSDVPPLLFGTAKISGTIPLIPDGRPAIGVIIGLIVSVADGDVQILPGEYSNITLAPPDATMPSDLGKIEYRYDRPFWVEAVAKMLDEDAAL